VASGTVRTFAFGFAVQKKDVIYAVITLTVLRKESVGSVLERERELGLGPID
jgi:hypothetical protein